MPTSRYHTGVPMHYTYRLPKVVGRVPVSPPRSAQAKHRLRILEYGQTHSVSATCRHYGIARSTYYRWKSRYVPARSSTLENLSSRPTRTRRRTWTTDQVVAVREMRKRFPRTGKDKLALLLEQQGIALSVSMVGRILVHLRSTHQLIEPLSATGWKPHARHKRPYAIRKPKGYPVDQPGDLLQVDTKVPRTGYGTSSGAGHDSAALHCGGSCESVLDCHRATRGDSGNSPGLSRPDC